MVRLDRPRDVPLMHEVLAEEHERVRRARDVLDAVAPGPTTAGARRRGHGQVDGVGAGGRVHAFRLGVCVCVCVACGGLGRRGGGGGR